MNDLIIYEHPLNETIRACLRLEHLFIQIDHHLADVSLHGNRQIITSILHLLHLLDRPDLKSKLAKELINIQLNLKNQSNHSHLNEETRKDFMVKLEDLSRRLIDSSSKIAYRLRDVHLLNVLRLHLQNPAGDCSFDVPLYHYFLHRPSNERTEILKSWLTEFTEMRATTAFVLDLLRQSAVHSSKNAVSGFHQELLDAQTSLRMIIISLPREVAALPEISVGKHFLSVRFFNPSIDQRPTQLKQDIRFDLAYCY